MKLELRKTTFLRSGNMACAPRSNKKATKIAFDVLGTPPNLKSKRTAKQQWIDKMLSQQETSRVK